MTEYYKSYRIIDGKSRWVIVDETGKIVNRYPSKDELKGLKKEKYIRNTKYADLELLDILRQFYVENGRPPVVMDFNIGDLRYPGAITYRRHFGSWSNALKLVGLDVESMVKKGVLITEQQKARFAEMIVRDHFKKNPIDLAGENCRSPCDGICPNGKMYDVKSSKFYIDKERYSFYTNNKYRDNIEIYYFLAFNSDRTKLECAWRVPGEIVEKNHFYVGLNPSCDVNIEDMDKYDITNNIREVLNRYGFFNKI